MMEKTARSQSIWPHAGTERPATTRSRAAATEYGDGRVERKAGPAHGKRETAEAAARNDSKIADPATADAAALDDTPDGPDDGLSDTTIGYLVRDVHRAFSRALQTRIASHGVTMGQWFFLRALWDEDGLTQRELSQRVGMMEPTTVTALNGMERHGLVERVRNPNDRRKVNIFLTAKGRALRDVLLPCSLDVNREAVSEIAEDDVAKAVLVLRQMIVNLNGAGAAGAGAGGAVDRRNRGPVNGRGNGHGGGRPSAAPGPLMTPE